MFYDVPIGGTDVPLIVMWSAVAALFFTVYLRFINVRALGLAIRHAKGDFADPTARGEISHFQAVATAVSGTVGVGNIGGVAVAITVGGPGAAFWLFIAGLLSMSTKLVECTLGVKYRRYNADGSVSGGPMFYMEASFASAAGQPSARALVRFTPLRWSSGVWVSVTCFSPIRHLRRCWSSPVARNQSSPIGAGFLDCLAGVIAAVIIGGIQSIARVAAVLVPVMALLYLISALAVIGLSAEHPRRAVVGGLRGLHRAGGLGWSAWRHGHWIPACAFFQRGRYWLCIDCALCRENRSPGVRGHHSAARAVY